MAIATNRPFELDYHQEKLKYDIRSILETGRCRGYSHVDKMEVYNALTVTSSRFFNPDRPLDITERLAMDMLRGRYRCNMTGKLVDYVGNPTGLRPLGEIPPPPKTSVKTDSQLLLLL